MAGGIKVIITKSRSDPYSCMHSLTNHIRYRPMQSGHIGIKHREGLLQSVIFLTNCCCFRFPVLSKRIRWLRSLFAYSMDSKSG